MSWIQYRSPEWKINWKIIGNLHKLNQPAEIAIRLHLDMDVNRGEIGSNDSKKGDVNNIMINMHIG